MINQHLLKPASFNHYAIFSVANKVLVFFLVSTHCKFKFIVKMSSLKRSSRSMKVMRFEII